jgi:hypothetical protein
VAFVLHALGYSKLNQLHKDAEQKAWDDVLDLLPVSTLDPDSVRQSLPKPPKECGKPLCRIFDPAEPS